MKKSRGSEGQIIGILKQHGASMKTPDSLEELGLSAAQFLRLNVLDHREIKRCWDSTDSWGRVK